MRAHHWTRRLAAATAAAVLGLSASASAQSRSVRVEVPPVNVRVHLDQLAETLRSLDFGQVRFDFDFDFDDFDFDMDFDALDFDIDVLSHLDGLASLGSLDRLGGLAGLSELSGLGIERHLPASARQNREFREQVEDRQTLNLDVGTSGFLELNNISGDITVTSGSGSSARVEVVRTSRGRTAADARRGLDEVTVETSESGGGARVRTQYPENQRRSPYSVSATYTVSAPAGTRLTIHSVSGDVDVRGIQGDVSVDVISGTVGVRGARRAVSAKSVSGSVTVSDVRTDGSVELTTISGNATVRDAEAGRLSVNGVSGDVTVEDVRTASADLKSLAGDLTFVGAFSNDGRYEFQTHSGDVDVTLTSATGFDLRASTFSGDIRPDSSIEMNNVSTSRRTFRGQAGGGGATVTASTFSGDVVIRRR